MFTNIAIAADVNGWITRLRRSIRGVLEAITRHQKNTSPYIGRGIRVSAEVAPQARVWDRRRKI